MFFFFFLRKIDTPFRLGVPSLGYDPGVRETRTPSPSPHTHVPFNAERNVGRPKSRLNPRGTREHSTVHTHTAGPPSPTPITRLVRLGRLAKAFNRLSKAWLCYPPACAAAVVTGGLQVFCPALSFSVGKSMGFLGVGNQLLRLDTCNCISWILNGQMREFWNRNQHTVWVSISGSRSLVHFELWFHSCSQEEEGGWDGSKCLAYTFLTPLHQIRYLGGGGTVPWSQVTHMQSPNTHIMFVVRIHFGRIGESGSCGVPPYSKIREYSGAAVEARGTSKYWRCFLGDRYESSKIKLASETKHC